MSRGRGRAPWYEVPWERGKACMDGSRDCIGIVMEYLRDLAHEILSSIDASSMDTNPFPLPSVVEFTENYVEAKRLIPCIEPSSDYKSFLLNQVNMLMKTLFNRAMEASSRYLDHPNPGMYSTVTSMLVGYSISMIEALMIAREAVEYASDIITLSEVERIVFASSARFLGFTILVEELGHKRIKHYLGKLLVAAEFFAREDQDTMTRLLYMLRSPILYTS